MIPKMLYYSETKISIDYTVEFVHAIQEHMPKVNLLLCAVPPPMWQAVRSIPGRSQSENRIN
jgi:hypothetical protein